MGPSISDDHCRLALRSPPPESVAVPLKAMLEPLANVDELAGAEMLRTASVFTPSVPVATGVIKTGVMLAMGVSEGAVFDLCRGALDRKRQRTLGALQGSS